MQQLTKVNNDDGDNSDYYIMSILLNTILKKNINHNNDGSDHKIVST